MADYRTVIGIVQFEPREGDAAGKKVRNIVVNSAGFGPYGVRVSATLWPSHAAFEVKENDVVILEGKYNKQDSTKDGQPITYHNLSVARAKNLGPADPGVQVDVEENQVEAAADDIPF